MLRCRADAEFQFPAGSFRIPETRPHRAKQIPVLGGRRIDSECGQDFGRRGVFFQLVAGERQEHACLVPSRPGVQRHLQRTDRLSVQDPLKQHLPDFEQRPGSQGTGCRESVEQCHGQVFPALFESRPSQVQSDARTPQAEIVGPLQMRNGSPVVTDPPVTPPGAMTEGRVLRLG